MSFWKDLKKPIFALAPMEDVTDCAFREMFAKYGKPDVLFTEFVSTDGLMHEEGRKKLSVDLQFTKIQRPIVAQIWGADPEKYYQVAQYLAQLGFDGIDINMGCPQSKEIGVGACAALIRNPKLAAQIINATQKGAGKLSVSVKTRIGYSKPEEMEEWIKYVLDTGIEALTLHGRTKKEMSKVPAHWDRIADAVKFRDRGGYKTLVLGNGDVKSREEGLERIAETGVDGVMIGRGAFGNPWIFGQLGGENESVIPEATRGYPESMDPGSKSGMTHPTVEERLRVMLEHTQLFESMYTGVKSFAIMRKHFKAYASGFPGAQELRMKLMETKNYEETKKIVEEYLSNKESV